MLYIYYLKYAPKILNYRPIFLMNKHIKFYNKVLEKLITRNYLVIKIIKEYHLIGFFPRNSRMVQ